MRRVSLQKQNFRRERWHGNQLHGYTLGGYMMQMMNLGVGSFHVIVKCLCLEEGKWVWKYT